uniref:Coat protein n=1 Tax=Botrytis cinerea victorivirus 3 TaxID=2746650 RepID=A0A7S5WSY4_9VIRU|nr:coat protein [Botrytis cinerea victorivirus 3]
MCNYSGRVGACASVDPNNQALLQRNRILDKTTRKFVEQLLYTMTNQLSPTFLSGVLANARGGRITAKDTYRRYKTIVRTSATIAGVLDTRLTGIFYEIGRAVDTKGKLLRNHPENITLVEASYPTNSVLAEDFIGMAKKYTNFSASFEYSSLAGIVERLGKGLAACSLFDNLTSTDLRGGAVLAVNALGTYDGPVNSLTDAVYIPRLVNTTLTGDVFAVLCNAVAGEGSQVVSDVVELDANTRQPIIPLVDNAGLPGAIVDALRVLGSNMIASDQGPLFSLALSRGLHRGLSLVGHTDEGSITRDLLRCGGFAPPFGGIHYGLEPYVGLPALQTNLDKGISAYVDAIVIATGAAVAHADPGTRFDGHWFPTFISGTASGEPLLRPGEHSEGTTAMADRIRARLLADQSPFWEGYTRALSIIFGAEGDTSLSVRFSCAASTALDVDNRHLKHASVSPWFWIEPTSILPPNLLGSEAEIEGCASLAYKDTVVSKPAWDTITRVGSSDVSFSAYRARFKFARQTWFFNHWLNHPMNGLGAMKVRQLDPNGIIHPGPCAAHPQVRDRVEADLPFTDYLWVRGQSPFPAPGELINLGLSVGFLVRHMTLDDEGIPNEEHLPTSREFQDCVVTLDVGRPIGLQSGKTNASDSQAKRARTRANNELAAARTRARQYGVPDVGEMPTLTTAPGYATRWSAEQGIDSTAGGTPLRGQHAHAAPGHASGGTREPTGQQNVAVPQHQPLRYPALPRQGAGLGGGANPIPPPPAPPAGGPDDGPPSDDDNTPPAPTAPLGLATTPPRSPAAPGNGPDTV